jgi:flagellar FliL protein
MSAVMAEPAADAAPIRRPRKKLILFGVLVLALVLALAAGVVVFLKQRAAHALAAAGEDEAVAEQSGPAHIDPKSVPIYLPLDPFIVNLADREADRYAQMGITLELDSNMSAEQVKAYMPAIRNAILLILANKTSKELLNREGKEQLAQEIMREAVRPMGIELAAPEPITPAPAEHATSAAAAASAAESASAAKPKAQRRRADMRNPILHVHFSSFIIQ